MVRNLVHFSSTEFRLIVPLLEHLIRCQDSRCKSLQKPARILTQILAQFLAPILTSILEASKNFFSLRTALPTGNTPNEICHGNAFCLAIRPPIIRLDTLLRHLQ